MRAVPQKSTALPDKIAGASRAIMDGMAAAEKESAAAQARLTESVLEQAERLSGKIQHAALPPMVMAALVCLSAYGSLPLWAGYCIGFGQTQPRALWPRMPSVRLTGGLCLATGLFCGVVTAGNFAEAEKGWGKSLLTALGFLPAGAVMLNVSVRGFVVGVHAGCDARSPPGINCFPGENRMVRHRQSQSPANFPSPPVRRRGGVQGVILDAFVANVYLPHVRLRKRSWRVDERIARQYLFAVFGDRQLSDIKRHEVEDWLHGLSAGGLAPATCNRILAVFKSICSLAGTRGLLSVGQSPCAGVSPFKIHTQREGYLTRDEARRLMRELEKSDRPEAAAIRLLLLTGARKSEILKARWENVRLDQRLLTVPLSKSNKPRHIPLSDEAAAVIRSIPRVPGCPWLFPGHATGKPLSDIYLFWNELRRELGLANVRIHDLRHTFASFLVNAGHSLYEVQRLLGHSDPRTTMRYAHLGQASLVAAAETVSGFLVRTSRGSSGDGNGGTSAVQPRGAAPCISRASPPDRMLRRGKRIRSEENGRGEYWICPAVPERERIYLAFFRRKSTPHRQTHCR